MKIEVQRMYRFDTDRPLKAFADIVVNDALLIKGLRVISGKTGLFVAMPREQAKDSMCYDTVRCLTQEIRDQITEHVLACYEDREPLRTEPMGEGLDIEQHNRRMNNDTT